MISYLRKYFILSILFLVTVNGFAQQIPLKQAMQLIERNSAFLSVNSNDLDNVIITNAYTDKISGMKLIYLQQSFKRIPVYNSLQVVTLKDEAVLSVTGNRIAKMEEKINVEKTVPSITAKRAVGFAARALNIPVDFQLENTLTIRKSSADNQKVTFGMSPISKEAITSDLMWIPLEDGTVKLSWQVKILPHNSVDYWLVFISTEDGSILIKVNLNVSCSFEIPENDKMSSLSSTGNLSGNSILSKEKSDKQFDDINSSNYRVIAFPAESMDFPNGTPVLVNNPWLNAGVGNAATTWGWHNDGTIEYSSTRGNNVWAKEDIAGDNSATGLSANSSTSAPNLNFDFPFTSTLPPGADDNQKFSITNLFYWNNIMHDIAYQYGFDEVSGNFQAYNKNRGGLAGDFVLADAQDGSGNNNANFSAGPDGNSPRMQMYLFNGPPKVLYVNSPSSAAGFIAAQEGKMDTDNKLADKGPVSGNMILYKDAPSGTGNLGCGAPLNAEKLTGKIVLIERGSCSFVEKILNAQNGGAKGVVIFDNVITNDLILMGGDDNTITIPAIAIRKSEGEALKTLMKTQTVNVTMQAGDNKIDGGLDNGIITHEYTHGISSRLTGGPFTATCLQNREQMGEGWSDFYSMMITTNWATASISDGSKLRSVGSYVLDADPASGTGIRSYPYTTDMDKNPLTYAHLASILTDKARPHEVGEIWAATLWDMAWNFIGMEGINPDLYNSNGRGGNSDALKLVTFAMKIQPCRPGFIDGRNALLKADEILFNGKYTCAIWQSFARRGMGVDAKQGDPNITTDQETSFSVLSGAILLKSVDKSISGQNDILTYTFIVSTQCAPITDYKVVDTLPVNVIWISGGNYNSANRTVTFTIPSIPANQSQTFSFKTKINQGTYFPPITLFSEMIENSCVPVSLVADPPSGDTWNASPEAHSLPYSLKSTGTSVKSEQTLTSYESYPVCGYVELSFWNFYDTEVTYDGGVVELSTDDGCSWIDAGPYMVQNGYNGSIKATTSLNNKDAFSGISNDFIQTKINLSSFDGESVKFRFRFVADRSNASNGWFIDDILITKAAAVYNIASLYSDTNLLQNESETVTNITAYVLPLVWGEFTVLKDAKTASLKWTTLQEINTDRFLVERSIDGINFSSVASIPAGGKSNSEVAYKMIDLSPSTGVNYYRIGQLDRDGKITYSDIRSLVFDGNNRAITISPNPAKDKIMVQLEGNKDAVQVDLLNTSGQKLATFILRQEKNKIDLPVLASGVYYLRVAGPDNKGIKKLIIE